VLGRGATLRCSAGSAGLVPPIPRRADWLGRAKVAGTVHHQSESGSTRARRIVQVDMEPSGAAKKPALEVIDRIEVVDCIASGRATK